MRIITLFIRLWLLITLMSVLTLRVMASDNFTYYGTQFKHIVVIVQENRTPDNLLQGLCSVSSMCGVPPITSGCPTASSTCQYDILTDNWLDNTQGGGTIHPTPVALGVSWDLDHTTTGFKAICDKTFGACLMDGNASNNCITTFPCPTGSRFSYVANTGQSATPCPSPVGPLDMYLCLVSEFGFGNLFFETNQSYSYLAHLYLFTGTSAISNSNDKAGIFLNGGGGTALVTPTAASGNSSIVVTLPAAQYPPSSGNATPNGLINISANTITGYTGTNPPATSGALVGTFAIGAVSGAGLGIITATPTSLTIPTNMSSGTVALAGSPHTIAFVEAVGCQATATISQIGPSPPPKVLPCQGAGANDFPTLTDLLDAKGVSWTYYGGPQAPVGYTDSAFGGIWVAPNSISHICGTVVNGACTGTEWNNHVVFTNAQILADAASPGCNLANVSWVIPTGTNSDHNGNSGNTGGPSWVSSIIHAIGTSACTDSGTSYWNDTAIIVLWDDWGGLYDHEPPTILPGLQGDFQIGLRVPLIVVSAYTPAGFISNTREDFGSVLRFIEQNFGINEGSLTFADSRGALPLSDMLEYFPTWAGSPNAYPGFPLLDIHHMVASLENNIPIPLFTLPRAFPDIKPPLDENYFLNAPPDNSPPDTE